MSITYPNVLALDASMTHVGWSYFCNDRLIDSGTLIPPRNSKDKTIDRVEIVSFYVRELTSIMNRCGLPWIKTLLVSETPYGSQSYSAAISVGIVCGVLGALQTTTGCDIVHYLPRRVKKFITGDDKASKTQIITEMYKLYPYADWKVNKQGIPLKLEEHRADSLAVYTYDKRLRVLNPS